ncbi:MAG TPA: NAD(P)-binding domain-containing protein [Vicinamibacterales bacterium]|nr:NAD(P)-binding domain-containing protein [Vicinamibacterales bacterium]
MTRFGILGSGAVGQTLASGLVKHGYEARVGSRTAGKLKDFTTRTGIADGSFADVAAWAEGLVLAVAGRIALDALELAGRANLTGKLVIDVTNPLDAAPPEDGVLRVFTGPNESLMERLQDAYPDVKFVKAFNSVGNAVMVNPSFPGGRPTMFFCGNDAAAKAVVQRILEQFGWEPADMGTAKAARAIEPLCQLWCIPGFRQNQWTHAFKLMA